MKRTVALLPLMMLLLMTAVQGWTATPTALDAAPTFMEACGKPVRIVVPESDPDGSYLVKWGASVTPGAVYVLQEAMDASFSTGLRDVYRGTALQTLLTGRSAGKTYFYRVRAAMAGMRVSPWNTGANGCAVRIPCAIPAEITVPQAPPRGNYTVHWGASTSMGVTYVLEESTDPSFGTERRIAYSGPALQAVISGRTAGITYYYRVQAIKSGKAPSRWRTGTNGCEVLLPCAAPGHLVVPAGDSDGSFSLRWEASTTPGARYLVQEAKNPAFTTGLRTVYQGSLLTAPISGLGTGIYYYRVRTVKAGAAPSAWKVGGKGCVVAGNGNWYMDVIVNLNASIPDEVEEDRLSNNWDGTKAALPLPLPAIADSKYDYKTTQTVYDTLSAKHELTVYFDRTSKPNQWEYLVTCDPSEDLRILTTAEQEIYSPLIRYDSHTHRGTGALLYGTFQFDTAGNLAQIDAFTVPADGQVDVAKNDNRLRLQPGDLYFSFPTNFTWSDVNQQIRINFGARMAGFASTLRQTLVSDAGAVAMGPGGYAAGSITANTTWTDVLDQDGNSMWPGDLFIFEGYTHDATPVNRLVYIVHPGNEVQDLLNHLEVTFGCSAGIDDHGRLWLKDNTAGPSSFYISRFATISSNGATPFGGGAGVNANSFAMTTEGITRDGTTPVIDETKPLPGLMGTNTIPIAVGDTFVFAGTEADGPAVAATTYVVGAGGTIQDLLDFVKTVYGGVAGGVEAVLDQNGRLLVADTGRSGLLSVEISYASGAASGANPFGLIDGAAGVALTSNSSVEGRINITTSKRMVVSPGRALRNAKEPDRPITALTQWNSVYDDNHDPQFNGGKPRRVVDGTQIIFSGKRGDGSSVSSAFTVEYLRVTDGKPGTVSDLLDQLASDFHCQAIIDAAGRLVLTDWVADTVNLDSQLMISDVVYKYFDPTGLPDPFGPAYSAFAFDIVPGDRGAEDASQQGDVVTTSFNPEALSTTQYASDSTTIFQNFYGQ